MATKTMSRRAMAWPSHVVLFAEPEIQPPPHTNTMTGSRCPARAAAGFQTLR